MLGLVINSFKTFFKHAPAVITQGKVLLASKEEKQALSIIKFIIILGSYLGIDNIEVLERLNTEDLLLIASIIAKHTYIKYIVLALTVHYCLKALFSIDLLKLTLKVLYSIPKALKFIAIKVFIGFLVMAFKDEITFKDYLRSIFYGIWYSYKVYYINTLANQQVIEIQKLQSKVKKEIIEIGKQAGNINEIEKLLNAKQEELKQNQRKINAIRKNQDEDLKEIARILAFEKMND